MRNLICIAALLLAACSTTPSDDPRQYLDEQTAATVTVVAEPWIFNRDGAPPQLDFVHLYAIDVNRMGTHRKYLAIVKHWPAEDMAPDQAPALALHTGDASIDLAPAKEEGRALGVAQPLDASAPRSAKTWFYPVDSAALSSLSLAPKLSLDLTDDTIRARYVVWRDGSAAMREFTANAQ